MAIHTRPAPPLNTALTYITYIKYHIHQGHPAHAGCPPCAWNVESAILKPTHHLRLFFLKDVTALRCGITFEFATLYGKLLAIYHILILAGRQSSREIYHIGVLDRKSVV